MQKTNLILALYLFILLSTTLSGQALFQGLNYPVNARGWGMGSAISSQSITGSGASLNPAVISRSPNVWQLNYTRFPLDISANSAYCVFTTPIKGKFALLLSYYNYGSFVERDWDGNETGNFNVYDLGSSISYARNISRRLSLGLSATFAQSQLNSLRATALTGSAGIYYYNEISTLSIGFGLRNYAFYMNSYLDNREKLSSNLVLGISKKLAHMPMILSVDIYPTYRDQYQVNIGGEFILSDHLFLRWGNSTKRFYNRGQEGFKNFFASATAGLGVNVHSFLFDIAVVSLSDAGYISSVSISKTL
ncbi:MAG: PorV/PorQ family protein [Candidatus Marinimicrobia bacterium]|nr:PorV/PorQ family protein [Candidatus Neomarinimicrobiota bacterium]RKY61122.1 MAG: hypothetical protein DRP96_04085 [Candidatus Neomarinimicrobiota bacterium]